MSFRTASMFGGSIAAILAVSACAHWDFTSAKSITVKPGKGGVLTLSPQSDPKARAKAQAIMNDTCQGKRPEITEEGETVVGSRTTANAREEGGHAAAQPSRGKWVAAARPTRETSETSESRNITEWRITYECK